MHTLDLVLMLPIAFAAIRGFGKGLVLELASFVALILAVIVTLKLTTEVMELIKPVLGNNRWLPFISYLLTFLGAYFLVIWLGKMLEGMLKLARLGTLNKLAGAAFGILKACFLFSLGMWVSDKLGIIGTGIRQHSFLYALLDGFAINLLYKLEPLLPFLKNMFLEIERLLEPRKTQMALLP